MKAFSKSNIQGKFSYYLTHLGSHLSVAGGFVMWFYLKGGPQNKFEWFAFWFILGSIIISGGISFHGAKKIAL